MISNNLKAILKLKKIPTARLAHAIGKSIPYIYKIEHITNSGSYNAKSISRICDYLHIGLDQFFIQTSTNLDFHVIKHFSRVINHKDGKTWIHLLLEATNPNYHGKAKTVGYFNFEARITISKNALSIDYQVSTSSRIFSKFVNGLHPVNKSYLIAIMNNKDNLIQCALEAISLDYRYILRDTEKLNASNIVGHWDVSLRLYPVYPQNRDIYNLRIAPQQLQQICCFFNLLNKNKFNPQNIQPISNEHRATIRKDNKNDIRIFGAFFYKHGGNEINRKISQPEFNNYMKSHLKP